MTEAEKAAEEPRATGPVTNARANAVDLDRAILLANPGTAYRARHEVTAHPQDLDTATDLLGRAAAPRHPTTRRPVLT